MRSLEFFLQFVTEPVSVSSVVPSSKALAEMVTNHGGVRDASFVVEFGPGTGAITQVIWDQLPRDAGFLAMEINPKFVSVLRRYYPQVPVVADSALNTRKYLEERGVASCDTIISGLPFASFDDDLQSRMLEESSKLLRPGGRFVTFSYLLSPYLPKGRRFGKKLREHFAEVEKSEVIWQNIPPAFVYCATKALS